MIYHVYHVCAMYFRFEHQTLYVHKQMVLPSLDPLTTYSRLLFLRRRWSSEQRLSIVPTLGSALGSALG
jgi:hypothetical protein